MRPPAENTPRPVVDVSAVEEVDYISDGRPMTEVIGARHRFDWIVASHVIEHVPDLLAFLIDCEALLKPGGSLVLALPDKRCFFDALRPVSDRRSRAAGARRCKKETAARRGIFEEISPWMHRKRNGRIGWSMAEREPFEEVRPLEEARQIFGTSL